MVDNELALGVRGMAVEDDYGVSQQGSPYRQQPHGNQSSLASGGNPSVQIRGPPPMQQPRGPYNGYAQADYATYYSGQSSGRESYVDYSYPYDAYRTTPDPSLYASQSISAANSPVYPSVSIYLSPRYLSWLILCTSSPAYSTIIQVPRGHPSIILPNLWYITLHLHIRRC